MKSLFAELRSRLGSNLKGVLPKWHGPFQARLTHSVIPSEVEESLILTITSSKRCLDYARHDKKPIWATRTPLSVERLALLSSIFNSSGFQSSCRALALTPVRLRPRSYPCR